MPESNIFMTIPPSPYQRPSVERARESLRPGVPTTLFKRIVTSGRRTLAFQQPREQISRSNTRSAMRGLCFLYYLHSESKGKEARTRRRNTHVSTLRCGFVISFVVRARGLVRAEPHRVAHGAIARVSRARVMWRKTNNSTCSAVRATRDAISPSRRRESCRRTRLFATRVDKDAASQHVLRLTMRVS